MLTTLTSALTPPAPSPARSHRARRAAPPPRLRRLALRSPGEVRFLDVVAIDSIDAAGNYCRIWSGNEVHRVRRGITELERLLDPDLFLRVHRSTMVNLDRIETIRIARNGQYLLVLRGGRRLSVGRTYRTALAERLLLDVEER